MTGTVFALALAGALALQAWARAQGYGFHRDELYYLACGDRLSLGYVDHSALVPLIARGVGADGLRMATATAYAGIVALGTLWAQTLGANRPQQVLAALLFAGAPGVLGGSAIFGTVVFEHLAAVTLGVAVAKWAYQPSNWWVLGLSSCFVGFAKPTGVLLALVFAIFMVWRNPVGRTGALCVILGALLGTLPLAIWQWRNGFPMREFIESQRENRGPDLTYYLLAPLMAGPVALALLFRYHRDNSLDRASGIAVSGFTLFALLRGKPYYPTPFYFPLLAALPRSVSASTGWIWAAAISGVVFIGLLWPLAPPRAQGHPALSIQEASRERLGWREWVATVEAEARTQGVNQVLVSNYGQAGALRQFGSGTLSVLCGHNQHAFWPSPPVAQDMLCVGYSEPWLRARFRNVQRLRTMTNPYGADNEEMGRPLWLVSEPIDPAALVRDIRHFD